MPKVTGPASPDGSLVMVDPGNGSPPVPFRASDAQANGWMDDPTAYNPSMTTPPPESGALSRIPGAGPITSGINALGSLAKAAEPAARFVPGLAGLAGPQPQNISAQVAADTTSGLPGGVPSREGAPITPGKAAGTFAGGEAPVVDPNAAILAALAAQKRPGGGGVGQGNGVLKQMDKDQAALQGAMANQGFVQASNANALAKAITDRNNTLTTQLTETDAQHLAQQQDLKQKEADIEKFSSDAAKMHTDPNRLWHNENTGQNIAQVMSMIFGGLGTWGGHAPNVGMEMWHQAVQNDLNAQRQDYEHAKDKTEAAKSIYGMAMQRYGRDDVASALHNSILNQQGSNMIEGLKTKIQGADNQAAMGVAQAQMQGEGTQKKLNAMTQIGAQTTQNLEQQKLKNELMFQGPQMQILHQQMVAPLINKVAQGGVLNQQERMTMNTLAPDKNKLEVTGYGYAKDDKTAEDANKVVRETAPAIKTIQSLKDVMAEADKNPLLKGDLQWRSRAIAAAGAARRAVMSQEGFKKMSETTQKEFKEEIPDKPWDYIMNTVGPRIDEAMHNQADVRDAALEAAGLPIPVHEEGYRFK